MQLDREDRNWLDAKFEQVNARIATLHVAFETHKATPCKWVKEHEGRHHLIGWPRILTMVLACVGGVAGVVALAREFSRG